MSREADQAVTMLSIIMGAMKCLQVEKAIAKVSIKRQIEENYNLAQRAINKWPVRINYDWVRDRFRQFTAVVNPPERTDEYQPIEMTRIAELLATDLQYIYRIGSRGDLVRPILPGLQVLLEHMDPEGRNFPAMDAAGANMKKLYDILEIKNL